MTKKSYNITGFDCANCARKTEDHLNRHHSILTARIDFSSNKLYISYKNNVLTIEELLSIIKEVETDPIVISESNQKLEKKKILTKNLWLLLLRVAIGLVIVLLSFTAFADNKYYWLVFSLYLIGLLILTFDILFKVVKHIISKENPIDEYLLILISAYGAFAIASVNFEAHEFMESIMVVALFQLGRVIEGIATNKSKEAIISAVDMRVEQASLLKNGEITKVSPEELQIGDVVVVVAGETIPIDGTVLNGEANIDVSSLTGEFVPFLANKNSQVYSGTTVKNGTIQIEVNKLYSDSTVRKISQLITSSGEKKSRSDKFITKFARYYTPCILLLSILFILIGGLVSKNWSEYGINGLKLLVVACPCAIVISVPMAYFSGLGLASKNGIVIKGTNYLEELVRMKKIITDKTGTLTHGSFSITKLVTVDKIKEDELLHYLYIAEVYSTHPIGRAICHGKNLKKLAANVTDFQEIAGFGTLAKYNNDLVIAGNNKLFEKLNIMVPSLDEIGTVIYCAVNNNYIGYIVLSDELKEDAQPMVDLLHSENIEIVLLTGDKNENAKDICKKLGIDRYQAELLPEEKTNALANEMPSNRKFSVAYIGDGINDAASIKRSDVGIAMGGIGSDIAVENADVVIMNDDPAKVYDAIKIGKMSRNTALFNVVFALTIKFTLEILIMILGGSIPMFVAVLADTGLTVLLVINSLILLYRKVKRKHI